MFKRLKRIEALLSEMVEMERRVEEIVQRREIRYALWDARDAIPWKCQAPDCAISWPHSHTIAMLPPASTPSGEVKNHV
jgi:hypothetical protein